MMNENRKNHAFFNNIACYWTKEGMIHWNQLVIPPTDRLNPPFETFLINFEFFLSWWSSSCRLATPSSQISEPLPLLSVWFAKTRVFAKFFSMIHLWNLNRKVRKSRFQAIRWVNMQEPPWNFKYVW